MNVPFSTHAKMKVHLSLVHHPKNFHSGMSLRNPIIIQCNLYLSVMYLTVMYLMCFKHFCYKFICLGNCWKRSVCLIGWYN